MTKTTIESNLLASIKSALSGKKSEHVSRKNRLANSYIYSVDEIVSKDNRLIRAIIDISTDRLRGEKEHEG